MLAKARWASAVDQPAGWSHDRVTRGKVFSEFRGYHFPTFGPPAVRLGQGGMNQYSLFLRLPFWMAAALFAGPPAMYLRRARRAAAGQGAGRCAACGYDLRASPSRCPECGAEPKGATA